MFEKKIDKIIASYGTNTVLRGSGGNLSKSSIWVERQNFYGDRFSADREVFLVVGFDTEFKTPDHALSRAELTEGMGKNNILSYQVYCKLYDPNQPDAAEWGGVCYPEPGERLSLPDVLTFGFWKGIQQGVLQQIPSRIYLVGHFTRADMPAFSDFKSMTQMMQCVRNTFLNINDHIAVTYGADGDDPVELQVFLRDTMLLTPATSKSLRALGELVGQEKIALDPDPERDKWYKQNMDVLLAERPELFDRYALNDAVICVRYLDQLIEQCRELLGKPKIPATLTSIGMDLLLQTWKKEMDLDPLAVLGKEKVYDTYYSKLKGRYVKKPREVDLDEVHWHIPLATECYHGGRNEQFWFGPGFEDDWTDYDLSSAYPSAMALLREPAWRETRTSTKLEDYAPDVLGIANVDFEFPASVRFPTLPVRSDNGLIFPRKGRSYCAAPEIALAQRLGAKIKIRHGVVIPYASDTLIFGEFIKKCISKRKSYPKGTLREQFWKELTNSSYGKTAQGLREKRVFDLRDPERNKPLPPSKITNPFFAAFITSFVRGVLGEIINGLPDTVCVFSCTTDGFLSNATPDEIAVATSGPLCELFSNSRRTLTGNADVLEIKHRIRRPLGWRTRGQATLLPGDGDHPPIVLAKGGIYLPEHYEDVQDQNQRIVELFLNRTPDDVIDLNIMTGVRDIIAFDADLVEKRVIKRLSMEFDWKRRPYAARQATDPQHVAFSTHPWESFAEFQLMRTYWTDFGIKSPRCLKSIDDFRSFARYVLSQSALKKEDARYLSKKRPDINRLRQSLSSAWRHSEAGLVWQQDGLSNGDFAAILSDAGIPCTRADVENGARKPFVPKRVPPTPYVYNALSALSARFPDIQNELLIGLSDSQIDLIAAINRPCRFIDRI
jgi:hypothetical protein